MSDCLKISGYLSAYLVADLAGELVFGTGTQVARFTIFFGDAGVFFCDRNSWTFLETSFTKEWSNKFIMASNIFITPVCWTPRRDEQ